MIGEADSLAAASLLHHAGSLHTHGAVRGQTSPVYQLTEKAVECSCSVFRQSYISCSRITQHLKVRIVYKHCCVKCTCG